MKILFLCGSLVPGRDGVGDYTRRLACELIRQGHQASIIALNDRLSDKPLVTAQLADGIQVSVLRLPVQITAKEKFKHAENFIMEFDPEWLSLQFVPFSYQNKGLPFGLGKRLAEIGKGRKWHVMFHEMWIGTEQQFIKKFIVQRLQIKIIKNILIQLAPIHVHTSIPYFQQNLKKFQIQASPLPIFSNIGNGNNSIKKNDSSFFKLAFFSQISINQEIIEYIQKLLIQLKVLNKNFSITFIGGNKDMSDKLAKQLMIAVPEIKSINCTGFLNESAISELLIMQNLGITPIPRHALGKSGSVAAFLSHGVPVAAPCVHPRYSSSEWGYFNDTVINLFELALNIDKITKNQICVSEIIQQEFSVKQIASIIIHSLY